MAIEFYRYSLERAKSDNNMDLYKESQYENRRCRDYIQDEETGFHANAYKDYCVDSDGKYTRKLINKFGFERVMNMYAVTVRSYKEDGRISKDIKEWATKFNAGIKDDEEMRECLITQINPGIINILAKHALDEFNNLNLFTREHCEEVGNFEDKVVVISHKHLKEEYWSPENQLWIATGGFGCSPTAIGRAVYATCLIDDDRGRWDRHQVLGVIKDEYLPDWAREKLEEMKPQEDTQNMGEMQL